jgi:TRAP-type C4-dicarboxylate transport system substrate-binding protein
MVLFVGLVVGVGWPAEGRAEDGAEHTLKLATLAPENSSWMQAFEKMDRQIRQETDGAVEFKVFPGGVMGGEGAMVRKMRTGQLDGAALTNTGLGEVAPEVLALQLPLTFQNWEEVDYVRDQMSDRFEQMLADAGFELLTWGDVGFAYVFSNQAVRTPGDIQTQKAWVWDSDPIMQKVMEVADVNAVPLDVADVLPSLSTGVIDAFTNSPYGAVSLQWYTRADYVTNLKLSVIVGGVVVTEEAIQRLPEEHREVVRSVADEQGEALLSQIRQDNEKAIETIQKADIEIVDPQNMEAWQSVAEEVRERLTGELFPASLVEEIENTLQEYRSSE